MRPNAFLMYMEQNLKNLIFCLFVHLCHLLLGECPRFIGVLPFLSFVTLLFSNHLQIVAHWSSVRLMVTSFVAGAPCPMHERASSIGWHACQRGWSPEGELQRHLYVGLQLEGTKVVLRSLGDANGEGLGASWGHLAPCRAAEMEGSEVVSLYLGWRKRWTPSCTIDSPPPAHLGSTPSEIAHLQLSQPPWQELTHHWTGCRTPYPQYSNP